jgi:UDP-glucose 4-epimerase
MIAYKDHVRDYLYVSDVARALVALLRADAVGAVNIGSGDGVSVEELAQAAAEAVSGKVTLLSLASTGSRFSESPGSVVAHVTRLRSLGWRPVTALADGLQAMAGTNGAWGTAVQ